MFVSWEAYCTRLNLSGCRARLLASTLTDTERPPVMSNNVLSLIERAKYVAFGMAGGLFVGLVLGWMFHGFVGALVRTVLIIIILLPFVFADHFLGQDHQQESRHNGCDPGGGLARTIRSAVARPGVRFCASIITPLHSICPNACFGIHPTSHGAATNGCAIHTRRCSRRPQAGL